MKRILRHPAVNAACISLFTAIYGLIFITTSGHREFKNALYYGSARQGVPSFWADWSDFLSAGHHAYIACALIAVTILVVALLLLRRRPYDEYHAPFWVSAPLWPLRSRSSP